MAEKINKINNNNVILKNITLSNFIILFNHTIINSFHHKKACFNKAR